MVAGREFQNLSIREQNYLSRFKIMRHVRGRVGWGGDYKKNFKMFQYMSREFIHQIIITIMYLVHLTSCSSISLTKSSEIRLLNFLL